MTTNTCPSRPPHLVELRHPKQCPRVALTTGDVTQRSKPLSTPDSTIPLFYSPTALPEHLRRFVVDMETGCWLWTGALNAAGYGVGPRMHGQGHSAHRAVYEHFHGPVDHATPMHHHCRVPACVNPAHIEPCTVRAHNRIHRRPRLDYVAPVRPNSKVNWKRFRVAGEPE
jgi:hypothetical protein